MMIARAAERFIKDGGVEGGNTAIEAWKNGIGEEMSLEEGREYYRNHPVMKLVTELLLKASVQFSRYHILLIEKAISEWEKTDIEKRRWDQLCKDVTSPIYTTRRRTTQILPLSSEMSGNQVFPKSIEDRE